MLGLFAGLLLPVGYLYGKELLNIKVETKQDVENVTSIPIVGEIGSSKEESAVVAITIRGRFFQSNFEALRTNLQYLLQAQKSQVILLTSGMSGEGKSFITVNLGSALAISGKKVILLELDLRKPKLSSSLGLENTTGFSNYMVSENEDVSKIIKPSAFHKNCFIISSGPIPPNPSEILLSSKLECMINQLKNHFDFIVIDSPPVGFVSDALLIEKFADITLYVIRQGYTLKSQVNIINDLLKSGRVKRPYLVGLTIYRPKRQDTMGTAMGMDMGTGYGYGYGYAEDHKSGRSIKKFFKRS